MLSSTDTRPSDRPRKDPAMNNLWSTQIQRISTLYASRALRFHDLFRETYVQAFGIPENPSILEVGCGPGVLCEALSRWYPAATVVGIHRDSNFIQFAAQRSPHIRYLEGDATALPFPDENFDVTISNTVQEHVPPEGFYGEQYRVLRKGGACLVLSSRRGYRVPAPCTQEMTDLEREVFEAVAPYDHALFQSAGIGAYATDERGIPVAMEQYGFRQVSTHYVTVNLTPDNPAYDAVTAHAIINADRQNDLDALACICEKAPGLIPDSTIIELRRQINEKYDRRLSLYDRNQKQWDCTVAIIQITKGIK